MKQSLFVDQLFDGDTYHHNMLLTIEDGLIVDRVTVDPKEMALSDVTKRGLLVPGFIDVQVNGGGGALFNNDPSLSCLKTIVQAHAEYGTTSCLPTLVTDTYEQREKAANAVALALKEKLPGVVGIHFEGPALSKVKKGTHDERLIRPLTKQDKLLFKRNDLGIKLITLAPETVELSDIEFLVSNDVIVCLGHSNASYETTKQALNSGARGFTHLFNAMSSFSARAPGMVGCALHDEDSWCGIIVDGHHVDPISLQIAKRMKGTAKLMLVTDAMAHLGTNIERIPFFGREIIRDGSKLTSTTGELAGSVLDMATAVADCQTMMNVTQDEALKMASVYPAQFLSLEKQLGKIDKGFKANMTLLDDDGHVLTTWIEGNIVFDQ